MSAGRMRQRYSRDLLVHLPRPRSSAAREVMAMSNSTYSSLPKPYEAAADAPILLHRGKSRHYTACAATGPFCRALPLARSIRQADCRPVAPSKRRGSRG
jgi:hypothetical protein